MKKRPEVYWPTTIVAAIAAAAMAAVSTRRIVAVSFTPVKPADAKRESSSSVQPPSGPMSKKS